MDIWNYYVYIIDCYTVMKVLIKIIELKFYLISVIAVLVVFLVSISNYVLFQLI